MKKINSGCTQFEKGVGLQGFIETDFFSHEPTLEVIIGAIMSGHFSICGYMWG